MLRGLTPYFLGSGQVTGVMFELFAEDVPGILIAFHCNVVAILHGLILTNRRNALKIFFSDTPHLPQKVLYFRMTHEVQTYFA